MRARQTFLSSGGRAILRPKDLNERAVRGLDRLRFSAQKPRGEAEVLRESSSDALRMTPSLSIVGCRGGFGPKLSLAYNHARRNRGHRRSKATEPRRRAGCWRGRRFCP